MKERKYHALLSHFRLPDYCIIYLTWDFVFPQSKLGLWLEYAMGLWVLLPRTHSPTSIRVPGFSPEISPTTLSLWLAVELPLCQSLGQKRVTYTWPIKTVILCAQSWACVPIRTPHMKSVGFYEIYLDVVCSHLGTMWTLKTHIHKEHEEKQNHETKENQHPMTSLKFPESSQAWLPPCLELFSYPK